MEQIKAGDDVLANEPDHGKATSHKVTALLKNHTLHLATVTVKEESTGKVGTVQATREHPFWSKDRGWVFAKDLKVGERLVNSEGKVVTVTALKITEQKCDTYNLEVEGVHTFYVLAGNVPVLVHNAYIFPEDPGAFSITPGGWAWAGYPTGPGAIPPPEGPFRLLKGSEYTDALNLKNMVNGMVHDSVGDLNGLDIHEIQPVKFGGDPVDLANKAALTPEDHLPYTRAFAKLQRDIEPHTPCP